MIMAIEKTGKVESGKADAGTKLEATKSVAELTGRITAAGFTVVGSPCRSHISRLLYCVPSTGADWSAMEKLVAIQAAQNRSDVALYCATMCQAAKRGKSLATHDKLTQHTGGADKRYSGAPNPVWNSLRKLGVEYPIPLVFDNGASVPSAGRGGSVIQLGKVEFDD